MPSTRHSMMFSMDADVVALDWLNVERGHNVMSDPVVADACVKTWLSAKDPLTGPFPCEY